MKCYSRDGVNYVELEMKTEKGWEVIVLRDPNEYQLPAERSEGIDPVAKFLPWQARRELMSNVVLVRGGDYSE